MSEDNKPFFEKLLSSEGQSEREDKVLEYISHRLRNGANLKETLQEEYVLRNTTQDERDRIIRNPKVVQQSRAGLNQYFDSEELIPEHPTAGAKRPRSSEGPRRKEPLIDVDGGKIGPPATGG